MKEIKFTTNYEPALSFADKSFKTKYEERVGNNPGYTQVVRGELKHLAVCPRCNNPVAILGIYKKIDVAPHARHAKGIDIPHVTKYNEFKYLNCPYHKRKASLVYGGGVRVKGKIPNYRLEKVPENILFA